MKWIISNPFTAFSYGFLYLSVLLLWISGNKKIFWGSALLISIVFGLLSHQIEVIAIVPIVCLAIVAYFNEAKNVSGIVRVVAGIFFLVLSVALAMHQLPGFHNLKVLDHVYISSDAIPFTLYLDIDKTIVGIFILGLGHQLISYKKEWLHLFKQLVIKVPIIILIIILFALVLGFVRVDFKIPSSFWIWSVTNLLFVCMAEEAFFRGFIQKNLNLMLRKLKYGSYCAILLASILFGLTHYAGGIKYMILVTIAGIGYGWIYYSTKRIEASIITHFSLNLTHFLCFTYPALANSI